MMGDGLDVWWYVHETIPTVYSSDGESNKGVEANAVASGYSWMK